MDGVMTCERFPSWRQLAVVLLTASLTSCGGGGGGSSTPVVVATPTPTPTQTASSGNTPTGPNAATAFTCPSTDSSANAVARSTASAGSDAMHRSFGLRTARPASNAAGLLAVTYGSAVASGTAATQAVAREQATGASVVRQFTFSHIGKVIHVLSVPAAQMNTVEATLRSQAGVLSVAPAGGRRYAATVNGPYWTNDPYFDGFLATQNTAAGNPNASTYEVLPYAESAGVPGQWDMHAIKLGYAFEYSQSSNGSTITNPSALGSSSVKIAIIDTGEDPTHPELHTKIAYQKCFITNAAGTAQSTSNFETDPMGHGTDVAGIAAADTNNAFGFTGTGGNVVIYGYRVFPTPDDNCTNDNTTDSQCSADTQDIASAINDAVNQGVNVISMSLGGGNGTGAGAGCPAAGVDSDPVEGAAVAEAIAANIVVVAAAGNSGGSGLAAPACDTGVIAVGASALADGQPNGTNSNASGEYVASYSQYGSPNTPQNPSSWGIVAPGGDPSGDSDNDDLHWIENIWTSTPYQASSSDNSFTGECTDDYPNSNGTTAPVDCRTLIAGTSMATPHVAGVAALILSVNSSYQSSTAMKNLLCATADDIASPYQGCGRLNAYTAMAHALSDTSPPTPTP